MKIKDMNVGQSGKVTAYSGSDKAYRNKLLQMGLTKQTEFKLVRKAPMGDPLEIETRGFKLTLRKSEADMLEVEAI